MSEEEPLLRQARYGGTRRLHDVWKDFKSFVDKGSVLDLAIGLIIGTAFSEIVNSFVVDIFSPFLGLIVSSKLSEKFFVLRSGENAPYKTREEAKNDGAITVNLGNFVQLVINFLWISAALFIVVRMIKIMERKKLAKELITEVKRECPFCYANIHGKAKKCSSCTADLDKLIEQDEVVVE